MADKNWREWFQPWILERGRDYWKRGCVIDLYREPDSVTATVEGSEDYGVVLFMDGDEITGMTCTCPYAGDGSECKHMAAALFALESVKPDRGIHLVLGDAFSWRETIARMSPEEIRGFLSEIVAKDKGLQEMLVLRYGEHTPELLEDTWEAQLSEVVCRYSVEDGYIDYNRAYDFYNELDDFLNDRIPLLLKSGKTMEAFRLVCMVYSTAMEEDADDSDGGLGILMDSCEETWFTLLSNATQVQEKEMYQWFADHLVVHSWCYGTEQVEEFLFSYGWCESLLENNLGLLDARIDKNQKSDYHLQKLLEWRASTMRKLGYPAEEMERYWKLYRNLAFVRDKELERHMAAYDYDRAIALLLEGKILDGENIWRAKQHSEKLIELYRITGQEEAYRKELQYQVFSCSQRDLRYVRELRSVSSDEEWRQYLEQLLTKYAKDILYYELLAYDKQWQRLFEAIKASGNLNRLNQYAHQLRQWSAEQVRDCYADFLQRAMHCASTRKMYEEVIGHLSILKDYPDGENTVQTLTTLWRKKYARRSAMLDELRKAGI